MTEEERAEMQRRQQADTDRIFTLPNLLSFFRLLLIPLIIYLYESEKLLWAFGVLTLSGLTDIVDGWIARTFHLVSDFGKAIDPVADKLTQIAVLLCLMPLKYWWVVGILVLKEVTIGLLGLLVIRRTGKVYSAGWYGKLCTVVIYFSMAALILWDVVMHRPLSETFVIVDALLITACVLLAFGKYLHYFTKVLREAREERARDCK